MHKKFIVTGVGIDPMWVPW